VGKGSFISPEQRSGIRAKVEPIALAMSRAGLTPNMLTLIGFGIAALGGVLAAVEWWLLAGVVATAIGSTRAGFDLGAWLSTAALVSAFMVSYTRAKSESLGFSSGTGMAAIGFAPREVRTVILGVAVVVAGIFGVTPELSDLGSLVLAIGLGLIAVLATVTVIQRIRFVTSQPPNPDNV
jgi:phosphatidylglycerophosphate synthase